MTTTIERPEVITPEELGGPDGHHPDAHRGDADHGHHEGPSGIVNWLTSTAHYVIASLLTFFLAGIMAVVLRAQLLDPHTSLVSYQTYNELFTMHGSLMLYLFAGPFAFGGLANYIVPLQVGAPDMAF